MNHQSLAVATCTAFLALPAFAQAQSAATAIRDIDHAYDRAFVEPNAPADLTRYFTSDGTIIPAIAPTVSGEKNIAAFWNGAFKTKFVGHVLQVVDVVSEGENAAVATGRYSATFKGQDGQPKTVGGDFIQVWEKRPEGWKIRFLSYNALPDRKEPIQQ